MMFGYGSRWPFWEVALMWSAMIAFLGLLIWAIYALVVSASRPDHGPDPQADSAARILDERLARGEIDAEEYRRLRDLIGSGRNDSSASAGSNR